MAALTSDAPAGVAAGSGPEEDELPQKTAVHFDETLPVDRPQPVDPEPEEESDIDTIRNAAPRHPQLDKLAESFHAASLQQQRLTHFDYQPFSLPSSRVHSRENSNPPTPIPPDSPRRSMNSPPLTPASTQERPSLRQNRSDEYRPVLLHPSRLHAGDPNTMTPQTSPPRSSPGTYPKDGEATSSSDSTSSSSRPVSAHSGHKSRHSQFQVGPVDTGYLPSSRADSPVESPAQSGAATPVAGYPPSRPFTPAGEPDDPYARHKRPPQSKKLEDIEPRFKFGKNRGHNHSSSNLSAHAHEKLDKKHHSHLSLSTLKHNEDGGSSLGPKKGSMGDLKRFFKGSKKRAQSPSASSVTSSKSSSVSPGAAPFQEDHGLNKKYGKFGKVLGSGAGGSVRLMKRSRDGVTFAVKEFRARHSYETEREYAKKVTAEFCIGSTLHHGNIVETLDIIQERGRWYEVMEYCPYDLFATVMTGKMSKEEIACSFMQIVSGVTFLHSMGLAHRDLKLDNVVINEHGILKIIDFGSASVFRYPFENGIVEAHGIVGSDPYLAPEVCNELKYDPQPADVWSLAIIFCCMTLRRFPWKAPRQSDNSFRLFSSPPDPASENRETSQDHDGTSSNPAPNQVQGAGQPPPKGPNRLLRILPRESRHIVGRMLDLDSKKRATLNDIWRDEWISSIDFCMQEEDKITWATSHKHILEGQSPEKPEAPAKKSEDSSRRTK